MKRITLSFLVFALTMVYGITTNAQITAFLSDNVAYRITSEEDKTVAVCNYYEELTPIQGPGGTDVHPHSAPVRRSGETITIVPVTYTGDVVVSSVVEYNEASYRVTSVDSRAFAYCTNLLSVILPEGVETIGADAFFECYSLQGIVIPGSVTSIGKNAFFRCNALTTLTLSDGESPLELVGTHAKSAGYSSSDEWTGQFAYCPLENLYLGRKLTILNTEANVSPFPGVKKAVIGDNITEIAAELFNSCNNLNEVVIGENVERIGRGSFFTCSSLTSINLPAKLKYIDGAAFAYCTNLRFL